MPNPNHMTSRRKLLALAGAGASAAWLAPMVSAASRRFGAAGAAEPGEGIVEGIRQSAATGDITVQQLRGNITAILGSGGNIAVLGGPDGKLLVDAGIPGSQGKIAAALAAVGPEPIRYLINTHWHFDHTDGNDWLHEAGATIISHHNTRKHLSRPTRVIGWHFTFPARPAGALPTILFSQQMMMHHNANRILIDYYAPAHTDSDSSVYFPDADVLHVGDTWWNGHYPFIDYSTGGSIDGTIAAAEFNLSRVSEKTIVIPGHGPIGGKAELAEFREMLVDIRDRVTALKAEGKSLEAAVAAKPTAPYDERWGRFATTPEAFVGLVYLGV